MNLSKYTHYSLLKLILINKISIYRRQSNGLFGSDNSALSTAIYVLGAITLLQSLASIAIPFLTKTDETAEKKKKKKKKTKTTDETKINEADKEVKEALKKAQQKFD